MLLVVLMAAMKPAVSKTKATYTIDFIGAAAEKPVRYGEPQSKPAAPVAAPEVKEQPKAEVKEEAKPAIPVKKEAPKPKRPAYNAKEQIAAKAKKNAAKPAPKETPKPKEEKVVLSKPSILGEVESSNISAGDLHSLDAGGESNTVRASFTNFPYPWYITQVRNALWREWSKRMPKKSGLSTLVSFNIDKYGAVYSVQIERSSGDEGYDYASTTAANSSAPYPPLPKDFPKDILTVTVEFKNED